MYCKHCGKEISDDSKWCPECGKSLSTETVTENPGIKIHCPKCKSKRLQITAGTASSSTVAVPLGNTRIAVGGTDTKIMHTWFCQDCGNQFRDPKELQQELESYKKYAIIIRAFSILGSILSCFIIATVAPPLLHMIIIIWLLMDGAVVWLTKSNFEEKQKEYEYLQKNCFD